MKNELTSKERILLTLAHKPTDRVPMAMRGLCHGWTGFMSPRIDDPFDEAEYLLSLGLDTSVALRTGRGGKNFSGRNVRVSQRTEYMEGERNPVKIKEYGTEAGTLKQEIRTGGGYELDDVPLFLDDHVPPARSRKYLIDREEELEAFRALMKAPDRGEMEDEYEDDIAV